MADGDIHGRLSALGQVAHTNGAATTVASLTLPTADGVWTVTAKVSGSTASLGGIATITGLYQFVVLVDAGVAGLAGTEVHMEDLGATGYTIAPSFTGSDTVVSVAVTAANGYRSLAHIEAIGVALALA